MRLHEHPSEFRDLIAIVANKMHLPESAIERDYYIVLLLKNLAYEEHNMDILRKNRVFTPF